MLQVGLIRLIISTPFDTLFLWTLFYRLNRAESAKISSPVFLYKYQNRESVRENHHYKKSAFDNRQCSTTIKPQTNLLCVTSDNKISFKKLNLKILSYNKLNLMILQLWIRQTLITLCTQFPMLNRIEYTITINTNLERSSTQSTSTL